MTNSGNYDIIYISFSDLRTDGRSRNFIDSFSALGQKVFTISLAGNEEQETITEENTIRIKLKNSRFIRKWRKFASSPIFQRGQGGFDCHSIFCADLYSLPAAIKLSKKIAKETGRKPQIIYDSREIFSALGPLSGQSIKQKIIAFLEKRFILKVDKFVVSGELDSEYLREYFKTDKPFYVVKNYPKKQEIIKSDYLREKFNIPSEKKILVYQGVLLGGRGIMPIFKAMNQLKDRYAFCIIGSGGKEEEFRKFVFDNNLQDAVYFHPAVDYSELVNITASADIGLCLIEPISFSYELALPNKLFEYIACGLPVLVSDLPALRKAVRDYEVGGIVPKTLNESEIIASLDRFEQNYAKYKLNSEQKANEFFFEGQEEEIREMIV
jgi:glycosyltransferase involved in cell wall biosynthesis